MNEKIRKILELLAIITGISGVTLSNLRDNYSIAFFSTFVLLILATLIAFLSWKDNNVFSSKQDIGKIWQEIIKGASHSIRVFAGDVSWISRDKELLSSRIKEGIIISIICKKPHNPVTTENIRQLLLTGAEVKYYKSSKVPTVRGLIIDSEEKSQITALTISKSAKSKLKISQERTDIDVRRGSGEPGNTQIYQYQGIRYLPPKDVQQLQILSDFFDVMWSETNTGVVLAPIELPKKNIAQFLHSVSHYKQISASDIRFELVDIQNLWSTCNYVRDYNFPFVRSILEAFKTQQIQPFSTCLCTSHMLKSILLPPILEENNDKLIIIDGMHRLFLQLNFMQQSSALCLVLKTKINLPSLPVPFEKIQVSSHKVPRKQNFVDYKPELFRTIDLLDQQLKDEYVKYLVND